MKPNRDGGVVFESMGELNVVAAGLRVIDDVAMAPGSPIKPILDIVRNFAEDAGTATEQLIGDGVMEDREVSLTLTKKPHVELGEIAVSLVANNTTGHPLLEDPVQTQLANDMWREYTAAKNPGQPPAAPEA